MLQCSGWRTESNCNFERQVCANILERRNSCWNSPESKPQCIDPNRRIFVDFGHILVSLIKHLGLKDGNKLLILDSHATYVFNWEFIHLIHHNKVTVLAIPPHTMHCLQPLDSEPVDSLKHKWNTGLYREIFKHLTRPEWFDIFVDLYKKAMSTGHI